MNYLLSEILLPILVGSALAGAALLGQLAMCGLRTAMCALAVAFAGMAVCAVLTGFPSLAIMCVAACGEAYASGNLSHWTWNALAVGVPVVGALLYRTTNSSTPS